MMKANSNTKQHRANPTIIVQTKIKFIIQLAIDEKSLFIICNKFQSLALQPYKYQCINVGCWL